MEPNREWYETRKRSASHRITQVGSGEDFNIMIANIVEKPITIRKGQPDGTIDPRPSAITESPISHAKIFGIE